MFSTVRTRLLAGLICCWMVAACGGTDEQGPARSPADSLPQRQEQPVGQEEPEDLYPLIRYRRTTIATSGELDTLRRAYANRDSTKAAYRALTTINRKDLRYFRTGDTVLFPDAIVEDLRAYSVFPHRYPAAADIPKIILVSNKMQCYACYEHGRLVHFAAANTGEERKPTFPGRYALNWKSRLRKSSLNDDWELPFTWNFHRYAGSAFHQFDMPGRPVSHSCVRQFRDDAEWLFRWGDGAKYDSSKHAIPFSGTPVLIIDVFDFSRKKGGPWWELTSNKDGVIDLPEDPLAMEEALIPLSQIPQIVRGGLPNRQRYVTAEDTLRARGLIRPGVRLLASIDYNKRRAERAARKAREAEAKKQKEEAQKQGDAAQYTPPADNTTAPVPVQEGS